MKLDPLIVSRNKLYTILSIGFGMGYGWLVYQLHAAMSHSHGPTLCLIKNVTGIPCPSCGITRAVMAIIHGDMNGAFYSNPLGFLVAVGLAVGPVWLLMDLLLKKDSLWISYQRFEIWLRNPVRAIPLGMLVLINWCWNIYKGL
ncbi:DUF2752 domain-containing protein [Echinicola vietnamensis]|uniref:DUF2752 domain-containing protein n=1 Tax=Echinicola vietnamensis (strain DSM 17526 / LMG 23754 / KMM 6221) TaxID=926556 RepID=L0FW87_ECHVK|nr:DUF2752 domain-containing protein [Echinicola vietnamensis]AGA77308.1 Protein of unknown function (DUF2752) [Echinicola vietnamensis DSM 17526]